MTLLALGPCCSPPPPPLRRAPLRGAIILDLHHHHTPKTQNAYKGTLRCLTDFLGFYYGLLRHLLPAFLLSLFIYLPSDSPYHSVLGFPLYILWT